MTTTNMAAPVASVNEIVTLGTHLATALETLIQFNNTARERLDKVTSGVTGTASVLRQLQHVLASNQAVPGVFKDAAWTEVHDLAEQCRVLFKIVVALIVESSMTKKEDDSDSDGDSVVGIGDGDNDGRSTEPKASIKEIAAGPSTVSIAFNVMMIAKVDWKWLQKRVDRCYEQLRWLKMTLLLHLQILNLGELHASTTMGSRPGGTFDRELNLRLTAKKMRARQLTFAKSMANREARARRTAAYVASVTSEPPPKISVQGVDNVSPAKATGTVDSKADAPTKTPAETGPPGKDPVILNAESLAEPLPAVHEPRSTAPPYSARAPAGHQALPMMGPGFTEKPASADEKGPIPDMPSASGDGVTKGQGVFGSIASASASAAPVSVSTLFRPSLSDRVTGFFNRVLGKQNKLKTITEGALEAYLVNPGESRPTKLPFGHQQLKDGLVRALRKKGSSWNGFLALSPAKRQVVDKILKTWSADTPSMRTCIAVDECKSEGKLPSYVVFFSLAEPQALVSFTDAVGRKFQFPFEICKEWQDMERLILDAISHVDVIGPHVQEGHYDLIRDGAIVLPKLWSVTIRPGDKITMHMWPLGKFGGPSMPPGLPGRQLSGPPFPGPRPQPPLPPGVTRQPPPPRTMFNRPLGMPQPHPPPQMARAGLGAKPIITPCAPTGRAVSTPRLAAWMMMSPRQGAQRAREAQTVINMTREVEVVDFAEAARSNGNGVADLISRFTYIADAESPAFDCFNFESDDEDDIADYASTITASTVSTVSTIGC